MSPAAAKKKKPRRSSAHLSAPMLDGPGEVKALAQRIGGTTLLAARLGVTRQAVLQWARGVRKPEASYYLKMIALGLPATAWGMPPTPPQAPALPAAPPAAEAPPRQPASADLPRLDPNRTPSAREELERALKIVARQVLDADADPRATWRDRSNLSTALTTASRALARITGAEEPTDAQFLRSRIWKRILDALEGPMKRHPEAAAEVAQALEELGG